MPVKGLVSKGMGEEEEEEGGRRLLLAGRVEPWSPTTAAARPAIMTAADQEVFAGL